MKSTTRRKTALLSKLNIHKKPELDIVLAEAESHVTKNKEEINNKEVKPKKRRLYDNNKNCDVLSTHAKKAIVLSLWKGIQANIEGLEHIIGEDPSLKTVYQRIVFCIEDWKQENGLD